MRNIDYRFESGPFKGRSIYDAAVVKALAAQGVSQMPRAGFGMDAQPLLTTAPNNGIPAFMANFHNPEITRIFFAPLKAAEIFGRGTDGERKVGDMTTATQSFTVVERTGEVSSYGDFNNNGSTGVNTNFPYRQSYNFQTIVQYGTLETERMALATVDLVGEKREAAAWVINQARNTIYFNGVSGQQNYGILNDPVLPAAIQPGPKAYNSQAHGPWITNGVTTATPNEIYTDVLSMFTNLVSQCQGNVELNMESPLTLAMSATTQTAIKQANSFGITAEQLIKNNFPNIRFVTAPQYSTASGQLAQLIADEIMGQKTGYVAFNEKLRVFPLIPDVSSYKQKVAGGAWGAIIKQGYAFVQMLGL